MRHHILHLYPLEIVNLAARQNGRDDLVFLGRRQDKNGVRRRLLQCFQKSIERLLREHVHLIYDKNLVPALLRLKAHLFDQRTNVLHGVVRGGIEFSDVERCILIKRLA